MTPTNAGLVRTLTAERLIAALPGTTGPSAAPARTVTLTTLPSLPAAALAAAGPSTYGFTRLDDHGRCRDAALFTALGWTIAEAGVAASIVGPVTAQASLALAEVVQEMHRRQQRCAELGTRETEPGIVAPLIVVLIDEAAAYRRDKRHRDEFDRLLTLLAEQGRSSAISLVVLTQTPSVENVPSSIRNNLGVRLVHRCSTSSHSEVALGDGTARQPGWDASRLPYGRQHAGLGLAACEQTAGRPRRFRSFLLTETERADVLATSTRRRGGRGMMAPCNPPSPTS